MPVVEKKAVQREHIGGTCILTFRWNPPSNLNEADVMHYTIHINGTMYSSNETSTVAAFHVPNCGGHEISISAVNRCDREGLSSALLLDPDIRKPLSTVDGICGTEASTSVTVTDGTGSNKCKILLTKFYITTQHYLFIPIL